jgi:hypothetical protein
MSATLRQVNLPAVTAELLRVAESGDVDELQRLLPRVVDINARNRHGMTALMKAAFCGHEPAVRVLLEHGADPNLMRNDSFTALALAAFFGHGEIVKTLIEFGARTEVVTRAGASARAWARARTYEDVAKCLEKHAPPKKPVIAIAPTPAPVEPARVDSTPVTVIPTVKTLSDPPEIWDLVHEAPRDFNPSSAFIARLMSMRKTFALGACTLVLLIVGSVVGVWMLRSSPARGLPALKEVAPAPVAAETTVSEPAQPQQAVVENPPVEVVSDNHVRAVPNRARRSLRTSPVESEPQPEAAAVTPPTQSESPKPSPPVVKTNPTTALSPHLIAPAKNAPPKGKVIQWP